jgi:hypothetical protein
MAARAPLCIRPTAWIAPSPGWMHASDNQWLPVSCHGMLPDSLRVNGAVGRFGSNVRVPGADPG